MRNPGSNARPGSSRPRSSTPPTGKRSVLQPGAIGSDERRARTSAPPTSPQSSRSVNSTRRAPGGSTAPRPGNIPHRNPLADEGAPPPRLQQVLARAGVSSRRDAEDLITAGRVQVDGVTIRELGTRADPVRHQITVDGRPISVATVARYFALNKPRGYLSTVDDPFGRPTVMELVPPAPGLFPVGRLDEESEGLLLFTTDGEWAHRVTHPKFGCTKEYDVEVYGTPPRDIMETLRAPLEIGPGDRSTGAEVDVIANTGRNTRLRIILHEGRNRQIRRMCEAVGLSVVSLVRVRVGGVRLGSLPVGQWRTLTSNEVETVSTTPAPRRGKATTSRRRPPGARRAIAAPPDRRPAWGERRPS
ncbi:MAG: pseudouridine synthase [Chloroflexi bacterium]|nr:pseudouridine synthase [Chloroflexota bacterium]